MKPGTEVSAAVVVVVVGCRRCRGGRGGFGAVVVVVVVGLSCVVVVVVVGAVVVVVAAPGTVVVVVSGGLPAAIHSARVGAALRLAYGSMALGVRVWPDRGAHVAAQMDLEVQVAARVLGVAAVADVADEVAPLDARPVGETGGVGVLDPAQPVVGAGSVVVEVDVEVVVAVVTAQQDVVVGKVVVAGELAGEVEPVDRAVDHGQQGRHLRRHQVVAGVGAAARARRAEGVGPGDAVLEREEDRHHGGRSRSPQAAVETAAVSAEPRATGKTRRERATDQQNRRHPDGRAKLPSARKRRHGSPPAAAPGVFPCGWILSRP